MLEVKLIPLMHGSFSQPMPFDTWRVWSIACTLSRDRCARGFLFKITMRKGLFQVDILCTSVIQWTSIGTISSMRGIACLAELRKLLRVNHRVSERILAQNYINYSFMVRSPSFILIKMLVTASSGFKSRSNTSF